MSEDILERQWPSTYARINPLIAVKANTAAKINTAYSIIELAFLLKARITSPLLILPDKPRPRIFIVIMALHFLAISISFGYYIEVSSVMFQL